MVRRFWGALFALFVAQASSFGQSTFSWNLDANGTWDTTTTNWLLAGTPSAWSNGANTASFGGVITANRTVTVAAGGATAGALSFANTGSFAYTLQTGPITLNNGASDSLITIGRGVVGTATYSGTGGQTIASGITFNNNLNITNDGAFGTTNLTISGAIARSAAGGSIIVNGQGNTSISGAIGNTITGGITKNGTGTLNLTGAANAFTGGVTINGGVLAIASNDAMLGAATNQVTINNGGTFRFASTVSTARTFNFNGSAGIDLGSAVVATMSATNQLVGSNTSSLNLTLAGGTTAGVLSVEAANSTFQGTINVGNPGMVGSVFAQRLFTATSGATLRLQNAGTITGASAIVLNNQSTLQITQPTTAVTGRLGSTPLTFNSGRFLYTPSGNGGAQINDTFGNVNVNGQMWITGTATAGPATGTILNFGNIDLSSRPTLFLRAGITGTTSMLGLPDNSLGAGSVNIKFANLTNSGGSGTTRGVLPWAAYGTSTTGSFFGGFATYDTNGIRPLASTESTTMTADLTALAGTNVKGGATLTTYADVNSLHITSATAFTPVGTIGILSGAMIVDSASTASGGTINFGAATGFMHMSDTLTFSSVAGINGTAGLVVDAAASTSFNTLAFTNNANTFQGGLSIYGLARVTFNSNTQLGNNAGALAAGSVTLGGGQLLYTAAATTTLSDTGTHRPIVLLPGGQSVIGTTNATGVLQIPGLISGTGGLVQFGGGLTSSATGVVELTNTSANTYSGGTIVSTGILRISNSNQLGTGTVHLNGGTLQASAGLSFANAPVVIVSSTIDTQTNNIAFNGGLNGSGGTLGTSATSHILTKAGTGTLTIAGNSNYAGSMTLGNTAGALTINGNGRLPELGPVALGLNSTLNIDNSSTNITDRTGRTTNLTLSNSAGAAAGGATVNLTTNSAGSTFTFGSLTVSGGTATNINTSILNLIDGGTGNNTITFNSLTAVAANNVLNLVGTTNFGRDTAGGTRIFFLTPPTLTGGAIANVNFTGFGGSGFASYDPVLGVILLASSSGTFIDNITNVGPGSITPTNTAFTTTGATTANLGATIKSLTIAGHTVTMVPNVNSPQAGNLNAAANSLVLTGGGLTSNTAASTITSATATTVQFGATNAGILASTDLTIAANVTLAGTNGMTKTGAGVLNINGPYSITGLATVSAGTVNFNTGAVLNGLAGSASTVTVPTSQTLAFGGTATATYSGILDGPGTISTQAGFTGLQVLSGANTITGAVTLNGGTLASGSAGALGVAGNTAPFTVASGATLGFQGGATSTATNPTTISGTGTTGRFGAIDNIGGTNVFNAPITLAAPATIGAGAGTLTLGGTISAAGNVLTFAPQTGATINLNPSSPVALNLGTSQLNVAGTGNGALILPNVANTMGNQLITGGVVQAAADNNLGATSNTLTLDGGGFRYGANFSFDSARITSITANGGTFDSNSYSPTISGTVNIVSGAQLFKTGTGTLTLSPANSVSAAQAVVSGGTLLLGNANAAGLAGNYRLNGGTLDLNGNNATLGSSNILLTTTNVLTSSGGTSTVGITGITADTTLNVGVGGNLTVNKTDSFAVTLAGTSTPPATTTGVINVNAGTLITSATSVGGGMSWNVASGANQSFGTFGNNNTDTGAYGTLTTTGGNFLVTGGSGDLAVRNLVFTGGSLNFTGTTNFWWHMRTTGASIVTNAASTTVNFVGPTSGSRLQNDTAAALPIIVAAGTTPSGVDLNVNMLLSNGGSNANFSKQGSGLMQLSYPGTITGNFQVAAGTLRVAAGTTVSGTVAVSSGAQLQGSGTITGATTIDAGGVLAPGSSIGTMTVGNNITINGNPAPTTTQWNIELNGVAPNTIATADQANVDRLVLTGGTSILNFNTSATNRISINVTQLGGSFTLLSPVSYRIATVATAGNIQTAGGAFDSSHFDFTASGFAFDSTPTISIDGTHMVLTFVPTPEPTTIMAIGLASLAGLGYVRRRRKTATV